MEFSATTLALLYGLLGVLAWMLLVAPVVFGIYYLVTLPWRRRERAAVLLDLLELGRREGRSPMEILASLSAISDRRLSKRLRGLASHIERGLSLDQALDLVPQLLPPALDGMLRIGLRYGSPDRTLAVCRTALLRPLRPEQSVLIYLLILCSFFGLISFSMIGMVRWVVVPKFMAVLQDFTESGIQSSWQFTAMDISGWTFGVGAVVMLLVNFALFSHVGGPRLWGYMGGLDRLALIIPWRRDRIYRDFAAMLGLLLDSGVPESVALLEAARATGNRVMECRAGQAVEELRVGKLLPQALHALDVTGEFIWRLENARHGAWSKTGSRFSETLRVWLEALEARASQLESNAAQAIACAMILIFGAAVALECIGVFGLLVYIVENVA